MAENEIEVGYSQRTAGADGLIVYADCIGNPTIVCMQANVFAAPAWVYQRDASTSFAVKVWRNDGTTLVPSWTLIATNASAVFPIQFACSDLTTNLTVGANKAYDDAPNPMTVTDVFASVFVPQAAGSLLTIDVLKNGVSILDTPITIDNGELNSVTAAVPPVIKPGTTCVKGDRFSASILQVGTPVAKGLVLSINGV